MVRKVFEEKSIGGKGKEIAEQLEEKQIMKESNEVEIEPIKIQEEEFLPVEEDAEEKIEVEQIEEVEEIEKIEEIKPRISREERLKEASERKLRDEIASWKPKTEVGKKVKNFEIKDIDKIFDKGYKILEPEIVDILVKTSSELLNIGQSKGKFGGGKRRAWRQIQRKTAEGNIPSFACMAVVGDSNGHVGIGYAKAKETLPAREKAIRKAKLNFIRVNRGCGSFDCSCSLPHSVPLKIYGRQGSSRIWLMPAPRGTGLVVDGECKKILKLAGIKDVYSRTAGQTRTKFNLAKACIKALEQINKIVSVEK